MVRTISRYLPLTHLVALLRGLWFGMGWGNLLTEKGKHVTKDPNH